MERHLRSYEQEGVLEFRPRGNMPPPTNGDVWLVNKTEWGGSTVLSGAVLLGPGSQFEGRRVRVTVTLLEELPGCRHCGDPMHKDEDCSRIKKEPIL
jgi:hypothetical protein